MGKVRVPELETERLILRMWRRSDAADLYAYAKNPNVGPKAGWKPHASVRESRTIISSIFLANTTWAITMKGEGRVIGSIGFEPDPYRKNITSWELGYSLSEDYWGQGLMTEAARRLIHYAFTERHMQSLMIRTQEDNLRSRRVIEKCGFRYEGMLRRSYRMYDGEIRNTCVYSLLREEWPEVLREWEETWPETGKIVP